MLPLLLISRLYAADPVGFDAHGFNLAPDDGDPRDPIMLQRAGRLDAGDFYVGGLFEYASAPLVLMTSTDGADPVRTPVLDNVLAFNLAAGVSIIDGLRLDVAAPLYFSSMGLDGPQGVGIGDVRVDAMVSLVRPGPYDDGGGVGLALVPWVDLPAGSDDNNLGAGGFGGGGVAAFTWEKSFFTLDAQAGVQFKPAVSMDNINGSDNLIAGIGTGFLLGPRTGVNLEAHFAPPLVASDRAGTGSPAEAILSFRQHFKSGPHLTAGGALGLTRGVGAAAWRVFVGGGFGRYHEPGPRDADGDGFLDKNDTCPDKPETINEYADTDGCPDTLGSLRVRVIRDGKPFVGAPVALNGPGKHMDMTSEFDPARMTVTPGTAWRAMARLGTCLVGENSGTAVEGNMDLDVELKLVNPAPLHFIVHDDSGRIVPGVSVSLTAPDLDCLPAQELQEDDRGEVATTVGAGHVEFLVRAVGYAIARDALDVPPGTGASVEVTLRSTQIRLEKARIVILDKVYFETDKAIIKPMSYQLLDEIANTIVTNPNIGRVEVGGHTDSKGSDSANLDLSQRRAEAVRAYLIGKGVDAARLVAQGYGEGVPIDDNGSETGRAMNRRVEFNLVDQHE